MMGNQSELPVHSSVETERSPRPNSARMIVMVVLSFLIGASAGYFLHSSLPKEETETQPSLSRDYDSAVPETKLPDPASSERVRCTQEDCLYTYDGYYQGFARLQGYHQKYETTYYGEPVTCDVLVTTGGNEKLVTEFRERVESGNGINAIVDDQLLVKINLSDLSPSEKSLLENSSESNQVELGVLKEVSTGSDAPVCFSFVDIVHVKPI